MTNHGLGLLKRYGDSHINLLMQMFPDYKWLPWRFNNVPINYWRSAENQRKYMDWLGEKLGFNSIEDWYSISQAVYKCNSYL